ncbi:hypothetical protein LC653_12600 [Nostoc sp. CHAB 5784]|uniref:hypothetical protein n=1 Tax=Nostoc mirabile TaxID=2907820 RepID=UPI001E419406|nr:hypothetical protein [Nostoc mirabile]MCC5664736.1 hypothetical protein [Nostoc mirabile CHAB5784]
MLVTNISTFIVLTQISRIFVIASGAIAQVLRLHLVTFGAVNNDLGQKQKALDYINQALPLLHPVGDRFCANLLVKICRG